MQNKIQKFKIYGIRDCERGFNCFSVDCIEKVVSVIELICTSFELTFVRL